MKVQLDQGAYKPTRAHPEDAGYDLCAMFSQDVPPRGSVVCMTGVHVEIPEGHCGLLVSKSGLNVAEDMTTTGLIDSGYKGQITVKVYNHGNHYRHIMAGQKITQLVIVPCITEELEFVDRIGGGARGEHGFGSTGKL